MAFEAYTTQLLSRAAEVRDPGSADAYLRLGYAAEATLKLVGCCLLSEAVYRYGSEPAKKIIAAPVAGTDLDWNELMGVASRLPEECALARRLTTAPDDLDLLVDRWTRMNDLLVSELNLLPFRPTARKSLRWRHVLQYLPFLRNKVKGHGAPPSRFYPQLNPLLRDVIEVALRELVAPLPPALAFLRPTRDGHGVFLALDVPVKETEQRIGVPTLQPGDMVLQTGAGALPLVPLVTFDERSRALLVFNDSVNESTGELEYIDYLEGRTTRRPGHFVTRHGFAELGPSETTASPVLRSPAGALVPHNLPERRRAYVQRPELQTAIHRYLLDDRHRILSLDGRGGVGKTYLANEVCQQLASDPDVRERFGFVLWMSARDVDLTAAGPRPVRQDLVTLDDVLRFVRKAYDPGASAELRGDVLRASFVDACKALHPLLVFDNFETFENPEQLHRFLDDAVPFPAKVLITSRHRYFRGDFPIPVGAMSESESRELILREASARYVRPKFEAADRVRRVYEAAQGHAYTMRLIVAHVAKDMTVHEACAAVETSADVLSALFERSLRIAEPADAELAAVLAAFRAECPLEALLLLPIPRQDVEDAVGRLFNLSLLERIDEPLLRLPRYVCPRAAGEYIHRKRLLESPEQRARREAAVTSLRTHTQLLRTAVKRAPGGVQSAVQAADVMLGVARTALEAKGADVARRAVDLALEYGGEDGRVVSEAAMLLRLAGSAPGDVDGMFERALGLDPLNASSWLEWGTFKATVQDQPGQAMACFERALEADARSAAAGVAFAGAVLEVVKREKRLGFGAVRASDRRPARTLLRKADAVLGEQLQRGDLETDRARVLGLRGWVVLQLDGAGERVHAIVAEAQRLAPARPEIKGLAETVKRVEREPRPGVKDRR